MARKHELRALRAGTVINATSKRQEKDIIAALRKVEARLHEQHDGLVLKHESQWKLKDIVERLRMNFPDVPFHFNFETSSMRPDGGILYIEDTKGILFPVLISEVKNQGTNDLRKREGKKKQAKGNAIERLGKNVIGFRAALRNENIFPFVCFGYGCDFAGDSSILDRVVTINMFGELGQTNLYDLGPHGAFDRGSYYFREPRWSIDEMVEIMFDIADRSILYYRSKYGRERFRP